MGSLVRETRRLLPCILRVAIGAPPAQLTLVHVAMAACTGCFQTGKRGVEILTLEYRPVLWIDVFSGMALGAFQLRVFPFELPSGLRVIQFLLGDRPSHQAVIQSVVLRVASRAIITARTFHLCGVIAAFVSQPMGNFLVAFQATELRRSRAEHVATGALQWPSQVVMRFAKRAGRHLRKCFRRQHRYAPQHQRADAGTS